ncbi:TetR family transcriptional regulator [Nocardia sp. BSTN01]|uniref:TetR family transcriptional regulator n=1 Tax=Nocardia sp. BSTN01 TaxID=2783665 RepID=UPI0018904D67|nr:TetR family transcriptional regulator [Nocardia sp. BSTN01]MBF5001496.1 TetR family transcriptional regulator [Nocardia sp. BSTN01]
MEAVSARERLMVAGERLIAERGYLVPLRDIAAAAGQRNNSAIPYHFGSRDGLVEAVVQQRLATLEVRRLELLAQRPAADDVHTLLDALVIPMFELGARDESSHYARFLEQIRTHPAVSDAANLDSAERTSVRVIVGGLDRALSDLPPRLRHRRLRSLTTVLFALLADHERAVEAGRIAADDREAWHQVIDMLAGTLTAPVTSRTR